MQIRVDLSTHHATQRTLTHILCLLLFTILRLIIVVFLLLNVFFFQSRYVTIRLTQMCYMLTL